MEVKEAKRAVTTKPVPSRPTCYSFTSFSELLAGAINSSSSNAHPETAVSAVRPKTVRFKPLAPYAPAMVVSSQAEVPGAVICHPSAKVDEVSNSDSKSTVVYKPLAKVVSKATLSLLANLGDTIASHQQSLAQIDARVQPPNQFEYHFRSDLSLNIHQNFPRQPEREKASKPSRMASGNMEDDQKSLPLTSNGDQPSYDGYNWRKYGQKQVKGSENPRSYYKCTHPNCPVKKKVERSLDGQIAEIVYNGEHNHPKPQPAKRNTSGGQEEGFVSDGNVQETNNPAWGNQINERNEGSECRRENQNEVGLSSYSTYSGKAPLPYDPFAAGSIDTGAGTPEHSCGPGGDRVERSKGLEAEDDQPKSKRRKNEKGPGISEEGVQDPQVMVQSSTDSEIIGDGFRWRKYGQKVVKGNPYPRCYYRCTNLKCNVRKHVERTSDDPTAFVTTYEGKHNHDMPRIKSTDSQAAISSKDKP